MEQRDPQETVDTTSDTTQKSEHENSEKDGCPELGGTAQETQGETKTEKRTRQTGYARTYSCIEPELSKGERPKSRTRHGKANN